MKLLHTSDWHIGQQFFCYSRIEEHKQFLKQLAEIVGQEQPDVMVVSGDIFHTSTPPAEAQQLFVEGLLDVCSHAPAMHTIITAGNHDSGMRLEADKALWDDRNVSIVGKLPRDENRNLAPENFIRVIPNVAIIAAVPYVSPRFTNYGDIFGRIDKELDRLNAGGLPVVYMAHTSVNSGPGGTGDYGDDGIGGIDYVPLEQFGKGYDYLALGHIHKPYTIEGSDGRARYCGTPIATSFDEEKYQHGVDIVDIQRGAKPKVRTAKIEQKRGMRTLPEAKNPAPLDDALAMLDNLDNDCEDYVRLNVEVSTYLPVDAQERADKIANRKKCRLCQIMSTPKIRETNTGRKSMTISEFKEVSPMDIAKIEYKNNFGETMPNDIAEMLQNVIDSIGTTE